MVHHRSCYSEELKEQFFTVYYSSLIVHFSLSAWTKNFPWHLIPAMSDLSLLLGCRTLSQIRCKNLYTATWSIDTRSLGLCSGCYWHCPSYVHNATLREGHVPDILRRSKDDTSALRGDVWSSRNCGVFDLGGNTRLFSDNWKLHLSSYYIFLFRFVHNREPKSIHWTKKTDLLCFWRLPVQVGELFSPSSDWRRTFFWKIPIIEMCWVWW